MTRIAARLFAFAALLIAPLAHGVIYHVADCGLESHPSCVAGDNARSAATAQNSATPWKDFTNVTAAFFSGLAAGDEIRFARCSSIVKTISAGWINLNSTNASRIKIGAYTPTWCNSTDSGTATATAALTFTDTAKSWTVNQWAGYSVKFTRPNGQIEEAEILSNTATVLTLKPFLPDSGRAFVRTPATGQAYTLQGKRPIISSTVVGGTVFSFLDSGNQDHDEGYTLEDLDLRAGMHDLGAAVGTATSGTAGPPGTLTDTSKTWTVDEWAGYKLTILNGTGVGQTCTVASNSATQLTCSAAFSGAGLAPSSTSKYHLTSDATYGISWSADVWWLTIRNVRAVGFGAGIQCGAGGNTPNPPSDGTSRRFLITGNQLMSNATGYTSAGCWDVLLTGNIFARNAARNTLDHQAYPYSAVFGGKMQISRQQVYAHNYFTDGNVLPPGNCRGVQFVTHGEKRGIHFLYNEFYEDATVTSDQCWAIGVDSAAYTNPDTTQVPEEFQWLHVRGNKITNPGAGVGIGVDICKDCFIDSNEVFMEQPTGLCISMPDKYFNDPSVGVYADDATPERVYIRNNGCYYKNPGASTVAISLRRHINSQPGTGIVFTNNSVRFEGGTTGATICFHRANRNTSEFAEWNRNSCSSGGTTPAWADSHSTRATFNAATGFDADSLTAAPTFLATPTRAAPSQAQASGSVLNNAGSTTNYGRVAFDGCLQTSPPSIGSSPYRAGGSCTRVLSQPYSIR